MYSASFLVEFVGIYYMIYRYKYYIKFDKILTKLKIFIWG